MDNLIFRIKKSGEERGFNRPHICLDESCFMLWTAYRREYFDEGGSFECWGRLTETHEFQHKKTTHRNTHSHCIFTPLKGMIRFFLNDEDAWADIQGYRAIIRDCKEPWVCEGCEVHGDSARSGITQYSDDRKLCDRCSIREGYYYFDEEERKWKRDGLNPSGLRV